MYMVEPNILSHSTAHMTSHKSICLLFLFFFSSSRKVVLTGTTCEIGWSSFDKICIFHSNRLKTCSNRFYLLTNRIEAVRHLWRAFMGFPENLMKNLCFSILIAITLFSRHESFKFIFLECSNIDRIFISWIINQIRNSHLRLLTRSPPGHRHSRSSR